MQKRGDDLDIRPMSEICIKISVSADEAKKLGISFESFRAGDERTKDFLACALAVLRENSSAAAFGSSSVSVEVYQQEDEGLVIFMSRNIITAAVVSTDGESLLQRARTIFQRYSVQIEYSKLYRYCDHFCLIFAFNADSTLKLPKKIITDSITIEKIREYGKLLSDSPETLI